MTTPTRVPRVTLYGDFACRSLSVSEALEFHARDDMTVTLMLGAMRPGYLGREVVTVADLERWDAEDAAPTPRDLVALYAERIRLTRELSTNPAATAADVDRVLAAGNALDAACEQYRLAHHPDAQRVSVGLYAVFAVDRDGEITSIYDGFDEFAPKEALR